MDASQQRTQLEAVVRRVDQAGTDLQSRTDVELQRLSADLRARTQRAQPLDELLPDAFALVREAATRTIGQRHYDEQVMAGAAMHAGAVVDMDDGEGKTLAITLPAYLDALPGTGVHVMTATSHLARRSVDAMEPVYRFLGLEVACNRPSDDSWKARRAAYAADITYGRHYDFVADHLFDGRAIDPESAVQREHSCALVDEADYILIDCILNQPSIREHNRTTGKESVCGYLGLYEKVVGIGATVAMETATMRLGRDVDVVAIPPRHPRVRIDHPDIVHTSLLAALDDVEKTIRERHEAGQPILVGTRKAGTAHYLSKRLDQACIPHEVVDATDNEETDFTAAERVLSEAGRLGAVTILAGEVRGADIPLGDPDERDQVLRSGGLLVVGVERVLWSRRADERLAAWAGRRGEPGEVRFVYRFRSNDFPGRSFRSRPKTTERIARTQAEQRARWRQGYIEPMLEFVALTDEQHESFHSRRLEVLESADEAARPAMGEAFDEAWIGHLAVLRSLHADVDDQDSRLSSRAGRRVLDRACRRAKEHYDEMMRSLMTD